MDNCKVSREEKKANWDMIYWDKKGVVLPDGDVVHTVCVEIKNSYDTMTPSLIRKTYIVN